MHPPIYSVPHIPEELQSTLLEQSRTIYLSGPMKGYPQSNYPLFHAVAEALRSAGHSVHNPAEFPHDAASGPFPLRKAFAAYCKFICEEADTIVLLPGWEKSLGVSAELALARNCSLDIIEWPASAARRRTDHARDSSAPDRRR